MNYPHPLDEPMTWTESLTTGDGKYRVAAHHAIYGTTRTVAFTLNGHSITQEEFDTLKARRVVSSCSRWDDSVPELDRDAADRLLVALTMEV